MITITLQAATVSELHDQMRGFLFGALMNPKAIPQEKVDKILSSVGDDTPVGSTSENPEPQSAGGVAAPDVVEKEKKTRSRKAKETVLASPTPSSQDIPIQAKEEKPVAVAVEAKPAADLPIVVAGKESVHQALQQVNVAVGLTKAREILAEFKINRISEIKPEQYKAFVEKCNEAVMMHG